MPLHVSFVFEHATVHSEPRQEIPTQCPTPPAAPVPVQSKLHLPVVVQLTWLHEPLSPHLIAQSKPPPHETVLSQRVFSPVQSIVQVFPLHVAPGPTQ